MQRVRVKKPDLIDVLKKNRKRHEQFATRAKQRYRLAVVRELERMLKGARAGRPVKQFVGLTEPQDHTADYDRVIRMISMAVDDIIELDEESFAQYVLDNWAWKKGFVSSIGSYFAASELQSLSE